MSFVTMVLIENPAKNNLGKNDYLDYNLIVSTILMLCVYSQEQRKTDRQTETEKKEKDTQVILHTDLVWLLSHDCL